MGRSYFTYCKFGKRKVDQKFIQNIGVAKGVSKNGIELPEQGSGGAAPSR